MSRDRPQQPAPGQAVPVLTALAGRVESTVAALLAARREVVLARRCADVAELLSTAEAGLGRVALVSPGFAGLDAEAVSQVARAGCAVLGVVDAGAAGPAEPGGAAPGSAASSAPGSAAGSLARLGVSDVVDLPAGGARPGDLDAGSADLLVEAVVAASLPLSGWPAAVPASGDTDGRGGPRRLGESAGLEAVRRGRLLAVWGTPGAPGRTTVAVTVAAELAGLGEEVLLVDADTYAASTAQLLGLLDESPGVVAAVRAGAQGRLDSTTLAGMAPRVLPRLRVLTGIARSARWPELRPAGTDALWRAARALAGIVVVDLAAPLDEDDAAVETAAPRRNGVTIEALRSAELVLVVGSADPVGLQRLVRALQEFALTVPGVRADVVVNRVRPLAVGPRPAVRVRQALARFAGLRQVHLVPDDREALDRAVLAGRTLTEHAPASPARLALAELAARSRSAGRSPRQ